MEPINAFVGHSFADEDADVVGTILKYLSSITEVHPNFRWEHAESPEPKVVDAKVLARFADKNLFIGICTQRERVVQDNELTPPWYPRDSLAGKAAAFEWKTSDWIIQEIGLAIGRGLSVILLVENGIRSPCTASRASSRSQSASATF